MQRKISAGTLPEIAASETGIPWDEAKTWLAGGRDAHDFDDDGLRALAARAAAKAIATLERLADDEHGRESMSSVGGATQTTTYDDLAAAKALLDGALKIRRLLQGKKVAAAAAQAGADLFDRPRASSPWTFRKAE